MITVVPLIPVPNVGSQLERAIAAYLTSCGAGTWEQNFFTNDGRERKVPLNDILAHKSIETPTHSRNESYSVKITCEFPAKAQPGARAAWNRIQIDGWVGRVMAAFSQSNNGGGDYRLTEAGITAAGRALAVDGSDGADPDQVKWAAENQDMQFFTCLNGLRFIGSTRAARGEDGAIFWIEERNFQIDACSANVD